MAPNLQVNMYTELDAIVTLVHAMEYVRKTYRYAGFELYVYGSNGYTTLAAHIYKHFIK